MNDLAQVVLAFAVALPSAVALIGCCLAAMTEEGER